MTESDENTNENTKTKFKVWWNKKGKYNKIVTGAVSCCVGAFILFMILMALFPVTAISVDPTEVQIDNQTTEYTIHGTSEPNATVKITSPVLNLKDKVINVDSNGNFSYKINIPINVTEADVNITAKAPKKSQYGIKINIQRPLTPLTINPVNISSSATTVVINGKTDPNADIILNSKDLNMADVKLKADAQGNFNKTITVPTNLNEAEIEGTANATGKRVNAQKITINREEAPQATSTTSNSPTPNFSVGTSKFYLSGGFNQGTTTSGSEASRLTLDNSDIHAIVTEYSDKDLYSLESKNAGSYKTIDGVTVTKIPDTLSVFFEKNGKYYSIAMYQTDGQTPASETSETQQYLEDIIGSMQNA